MALTVRLRERYSKEIVPRLIEKFKFKNVMEVPRITKVVINVGVGDARENSKYMERTLEELKAISGQKAVVSKSRTSVANFKLREGMPIGAFVTLRGLRAFAFLEKLIDLSLPRVRDFRGISPNAFDGRGNYNLGIREQVIFPEVDYDKIAKVRGMNITICTSAKNDIEAKALLDELGMPFRK